MPAAQATILRMLLKLALELQVGSPFFQAATLPTLPQPTSHSHLQGRLLQPSRLLLGRGGCPSFILRLSSGHAACRGGGGALLLLLRL